MIAAIRPVQSLLLAIFMLMAGGGFLATLISLRLERAGAGTMAIGAVATAYFGGLVIGALRAGGIVRQVGHIRAFAAFVALLSASTLSYVLLDHPLLWAGLRLIDGVCVAGVFICLESWLNDRAEAQTRGSILAAYMVALYSGQAVGQLLLGASGALPAIPFQIASILISLAIIPLCLTRSSAPAPQDATAFSIRSLFAASPLGVVGAVATGLMLGAFYGLAAVHVRRLGLNLGATASFMMTVILGGVAMQWPLGRLSDRYDRRAVIVWSFAATLAVSVALAMLSGGGLPLLALGAAFGGRAQQRPAARVGTSRGQRAAGAALFGRRGAWTDGRGGGDDDGGGERPVPLHCPVRRRDARLRPLAPGVQRSRARARAAGFPDRAAHHAHGVAARPQYRCRHC